MAIFSGPLLGLFRDFDTKFCKQNTVKQATNFDVSSSREIEDISQKRHSNIKRLKKTKGKYLPGIFLTGSDEDSDARHLYDSQFSVTMESLRYSSSSKAAGLKLSILDSIVFKANAYSSNFCLIRMTANVAPIARIAIRKARRPETGSHCKSNLQARVGLTKNLWQLYNRRQNK